MSEKGLDQPGLISGNPAGDGLEAGYSPHALAWAAPLRSQRYRLDLSRHSDRIWADLALQLPEATCSGS